MSVKGYSFKEVAVILDGVLRVDEFYEGDGAVQVEPREDTSEPIVGPDGKVLLAIGADETHNIILRLKHTSPAHRYLNIRHAALRRGNLIPIAVAIAETRTLAGGIANKCFTLTKPTQAFARTPGVLEWRLFATKFTDETDLVVDTVL